MPDASTPLVIGFATLALLVAAGFVGGVRVAAPRATLAAALAVAAWLGLTGAAAAAGRLSFAGMPPTMMIVVVAGLVASLVVALGPIGARLAAGVPLALLVAFQVFRLPLELMMHEAFEQGLMPEQMSFSGYNFDILTGAFALPLAALYANGRIGTGALRVWNAIGLLLLINVVTIAILSAPLPFRAFHNEPANVWITAWPFVWLPTVMVPAALIGHIVIFRALASAVRAAAPRSGP